MAKTPRTWTGARTPSGLKRVRQAERRRDILQPRRSAAKTYVANALSVATHDADPQVAAVGARARACGARPRGEGRSHPPERGRAPQVAPDAEVQRRDRWRRRPDLSQGREDDLEGPGRRRPPRRGSPLGKANKAKGAQTAAGKARAAVSKSARDEAAASAAGRRDGRDDRGGEPATPKTAAKKAPAKAPAKASATKAAPKATATAKKAPAKKTAAKS